jgi:hypothetical protein
MKKIQLFALTVILECALFAVLVGGCAPKVEPAPNPPPATMSAPTGEITAGVSIQLPPDCPANIAAMLLSAGAVYTNGLYVFEAVDTNEKRRAETAALNHGAKLVPAKRP